MARNVSIEGFVIVSADGMLADANGVMPRALMFEDDQKFFFGALARAAISVHGRFSKEQDAGSPLRKRLWVTHRVPAVAPDPANANAWMWNPDGASFDQALQAAGVSEGLVAVVGGGRVFRLFLSIGYDAFHLSRAGRVRLPGGRLAFPVEPLKPPEEVLREAGLTPGPTQLLDATNDVTLTTWRR
ncbi:MAG TPA: dihydrofolate reductase [Pseudolabrys sp.]|nr:dihydrofolate reductase [Pseudolabrys sp.]